MMERYRRLENPPDDALNVIETGRLKGKNDINPQWRIEAMTEEYGECGVGWKYEVTDKTVHTLQDGQVILFMQIALYTKQGDGWSAPIVGMGGDFIVKQELKGLRANDEAWKMCLTDALGNAMRNLGVAAKVYRGKFDTKYNTEQPKEQPKEQPIEQQAWKKSYGKTYILSENGKWYEVGQLSMKHLQTVAKLKKYKGCLGDIQKAIMDKQVSDG